MAVKERYPGVRVVGFHPRAHHLDEALKLGAIDEGTADPATLCRGADVIFVATPVGAIGPTLGILADHLEAGAIVTDAGSTKAAVVAEARQKLGEGTTFIGGHPMAGSEQKGVTGAGATLFQNAVWVLTPDSNTDATAFGRLHSLLAGLGARVVALPALEHDKLVATVSHLPHLLAAALVDTVAEYTDKSETMLLLAAGGFRDMTRIAAGDSELWADICLSNSEAIIGAVDAFTAMLARAKACLQQGDREALVKLLEAARTMRASMIPAPLAAPMYEVEVPVTDTPGIISDLTLAFGEHGINIEDIQIVHTAESSGIIRLLVMESPKLEKALAGIRAQGYAALSRKVV